MSGPDAPVPPWGTPGSRDARPREEPHPFRPYAWLVKAAFVLVLLAVVWVGNWHSGRDEALRDRLERSWHTELVPFAPLEKQMQIWEGLPTTDASTSPDPAPEERQERAVRYAVVGEDDEVIPDRISPADARPGDLLVMTAAEPLCIPSRLVVEERPDEVRVTIVTRPGSAYRKEVRGRRDTAELVGELDKAQQDPPREDDAPGCDSMERIFSDEQRIGLRVVHVRLDRPLRDRTLVDTASGDEVLRVDTPPD